MLNRAYEYCENPAAASWNYISEFFASNVRVNVPSQLEFTTDGVASSLFRVSSYLTYPASKVHECYTMTKIVHELNPHSSNIGLTARKTYYYAEALEWALLAVWTVAPGAALRALACYIQEVGFTYLESGKEKKILPEDKTITLLNWNICCVGGGFSITDGGVMPWWHRIDKVLETIQQKDPDVLCLSETFDAKYQLRDALKKMGYNVCFNIGPNPQGISSGMLIASKYALTDIEFKRFPFEATYGRAAGSAKGGIIVTLTSEEKKVLSICFSHMNHSEVVEFPLEGEVKTREKQIDILKQLMDKAEGEQPVILTGDLNLDDNEYGTLRLGESFDKGNCPKEPKTWGGDGFCAGLENKNPSKPLNLDHTARYKSKGKASLQSQIVETGFDGEKFLVNAISDHSGVLTKIKIGE